MKKPIIILEWPEDLEDNEIINYSSFKIKKMSPVRFKLLRRKRTDEELKKLKEEIENEQQRLLYSSQDLYNTKKEQYIIAINPDFPNNLIKNMTSTDADFIIMKYESSMNEYINDINLPVIYVIPEEDIQKKYEWIGKYYMTHNMSSYSYFLKDYINNWEMKINEINSKKEPVFILKRGEYIDDSFLEHVINILDKT